MAWIRYPVNPSNMMFSQSISIDTSVNNANRFAYDPHLVSKLQIEESSLRQYKLPSSTGTGSVRIWLWFSFFRRWQWIPADTPRPLCCNVFSLLSECTQRTWRGCWVSLLTQKWSCWEQAHPHTKLPVETNDVQTWRNPSRQQKWDTLTTTLNTGDYTKSYGCGLKEVIKTVRACF